MNKLCAAIFYIFSSLVVQHQLYAQETTDENLDSLINSYLLDEVIITGKKDLVNKQSKVLSSIDDYLESNNAINMMKRGAYAAEPLLNGMASERSVITIDGMRIYGACTDKMDPITSYVEITNLSKANIQSGQSGSCHGGTIAGSIDLVRQHSTCDNSGFKGMLFSGLESNNFQKIVGTKLSYSGSKFFSDIDFTFRDANNYKAGGKEKIPYSQFTKYNLSTTQGWKINLRHSLTASVIYDRATDVGYPALPMDVSLAEAVISSLAYSFTNISPHIFNWDTKVYYNHVKHIMDDSKRPDVPIRMDMPGQTNTAGLYSMLQGSKDKHTWKANISGHFNKSFADMTMYPNNPGEKEMYMLTWPGVHTYYTGIFGEDKIRWNDNWNTVASIGTAMHYDAVKNDFGLNSLQIFYPELKQGKSRWLKNAGISSTYIKGILIQNFGLAYAERAPSVSEGYGFYLFNSFDRYDYVGNPFLKNEKSIELNLATTLVFSKFNIKGQINYFRIYDYIIGVPQKNLIPMTIGAEGVKTYQQFKNAHLFNAQLVMSYDLLDYLQLSGNVVYRLGKIEKQDLPQIQPLTYNAKLKFEKNDYLAEIQIEGAAKQSQYGQNFGESPAQKYTILNATLAKQFNISMQHQLIVKTGVENILDKNYSTFSDWNKIPRMGRNFFLNLIWRF
ncbi:MAG: hypothetical protein M9958_08715 [Chitinophagales bacterium]|nr:hypothetical protein [Chitinophagales bacterium]